MTIEDLHLGQVLTMYGYNCRVIRIDYLNDLVELKFPSGEKRWESIEDIQDANPLL